MKVATLLTTVLRSVGGDPLADLLDANGCILDIRFAGDLSAFPDRLSSGIAMTMSGGYTTEDTSPLGAATALTTNATSTLAQYASTPTAINNLSDMTVLVGVRLNGDHQDNPGYLVNFNNHYPAIRWNGVSGIDKAFVKDSGGQAVLTNSFNTVSTWALAVLRVRETGGDVESQLSWYYSGSLNNSSVNTESSVTRTKSADSIYMFNASGGGACGNLSCNMFTVHDNWLSDSVVEAIGALVTGS